MDHVLKNVYMMEIKLLAGLVKDKKRSVKAALLAHLATNILSKKQWNAKIRHVMTNILVVNILVKMIIHQFVLLMIVAPLLIITIQKYSMKPIIINVQQHVVVYGIMKQPL